jgi:hypothetical protein
LAQDRRGRAPPFERSAANATGAKDFDGVEHFDVTVLRNKYGTFLQAWQENSRIDAFCKSVVNKPRQLSDADFVAASGETATGRIQTAPTP